MDHQAIAQLLGNYGEFVGAIAVVVTLAYLAVQIRQNTRTIETTTLRSMQDVVLLTEKNERYISYLLKAQRGEPLTEEERAHMVERFLTIMRTLERIWLEHKLGAVSTAMFAQHLDLLRWAMSTPVAREMWVYMAQTFDSGFRETVDDEALANDAPTSGMLKAFLSLDARPTPT
jgi:hypothetical protein